MFPQINETFITDNYQTMIAQINRGLKLSICNDLCNHSIMLVLIKIYRLEIAIEIKFN